MIVLDTNVISELMRLRPEPAVHAWASAQPRGTMFTTSANLAEIFFGIRGLPFGRRRTALEKAATSLFEEDFRGRVLPFDAIAADRYCDIVLGRRRAGKPIEIFDALIASIASVAAVPIVTRDVAGFENCGLTIINPWNGP